MNINATLIGQTIAFFFFVLFVMKYVWPPLIGALDARRKKIADGLAAAEHGLKEQALAEENAKKQLHEAKLQAADIVAQAKKRASEIVDESKGTAREEGDRIKQAAQSEIEQEISRAKEQLRAEVSKIALAGAEKVLKKEIDAKSHSKTLDDLVAQI